MSALQTAIDSIGREMAAQTARKHQLGMMPPARRDYTKMSRITVRLVRIMEANDHPVARGGYEGFTQMMTPSPAKKKKLAAEKLLYLRAERDCLRRQGKPRRRTDARLMEAIRLIIADALAMHREDRRPVQPSLIERAMRAAQ